MHSKPVHNYTCLHNMLSPSSLPPPLSQPPQLPLGGWPIMRRSKKCPPCARHAAGAISEPQVIAQFLILLAGGLGVSYTLDRWAGHEFPTLLCLATFGSFISYIYSAPPLKLKQSGWIGNYALGSSYIALPWWAGQVIIPSHASANLPWLVVVLDRGTTQSAAAEGKQSLSAEQTVHTHFLGCNHKCCDCHCGG